MILKYTTYVQNILKCNVKPEPWLHIAIIKFVSNISWAIYVWDTRNVIATGFGSATLLQKLQYSQRALDNHNKLMTNVSKSKPIVNFINDKIMQ